MDPIPWLLDGDPAIRWQVMRDLTDATEPAVHRMRARVAREGWGARLLDLQHDDGGWGEGVYSPKWTSTTYTLLVLRHLGVPPQAPRVRRAVAAVRRHQTMGRANQPLFRYRGETCITGMVLALASYFDPDSDAADDVARFLRSEQLGDGGWNCEASRKGSTRSSFNTTVSAIEGLLEYERARKAARTATAARRRGEKYLISRRMLRSLSTGEVVNPRWKAFSFPPRWHYDVLRGLDHLAAARAKCDDRLDEALDLVESKRRPDGTWPVQNHHAGLEHFVMERTGKPSRWNTLRAMRVLRWAGRA
ncbi:MAG TPA: hypothetical protein DCY40_05075 [Actinobacteria bacterium]|nr:hypothetical protein [Actinomycetota bacterium]